MEEWMPGQDLGERYKEGLKRERWGEGGGWRERGKMREKEREREREREREGGMEHRLA
jgi:hypothetical protein